MPATAAPSWFFYGQLRYGRPAPRYTATESSVSVVLPGGAANLELVRWVVAEGRSGREWTLAELLLLRACAEQRDLTTEEAAKAIQSDPERAKSLLGRLIEAGVVERRGRSYHLSGEMYRVLGNKSGYVRTRGFEPIQQEQMVLQYVRSHGRITRREAAELCKINENQASFLLRKLRNDSRLKLVGVGRNAHYLGM